MLRITCGLFFLALINACASASLDPGAFRSQHSHRFKQPSEKAARCFARNAEEHSSALMSEVQVRGDGSAEVIIRVKNGVPYAMAEIHAAGNASAGTIRLMVMRNTGSSRDLLNELVEGC